MICREYLAHGIGHDLSSFTIRPRAGMHGRPDVPCSSRGLGVCQGSTISWTKSADLRAVQLRHERHTHGMVNDAPRNHHFTATFLMWCGSGRRPVGPGSNRHRP